MASNVSNILDPQDTLSAPSILPIRQIPPIVTVWASLIPLAIHLATAVDSHQLVGQLALKGRLAINLCPRLGFYKNIYNLLSSGQSFYDEASSKAGLSMTAFDVSWGSIFPIANGDAFKKIVEYARSDKKTPALYEEQPETKNTMQTGWRRYQTLHVQRFARKRATKQRLAVRLSKTLWETGILTAIDVAFRISLVVAFALIGCYGTTALVACTLLVKALSYRVPFRRPMSFLTNNEAHDGYMLAACHANASEWYLLAGDRGVIDCLVNKPMITLDASSGLLANCFLLAEGVQLAAMTYVAAAQNLDGVCMAALILAARLIHWAYSSRALVAEWLGKDDVVVDSTKIVFSGRTQMMGAIYLNSSAEGTAWLDPILVDNPRRQAWLEQLRAHKRGAAVLEKGSLDHLQNHDKSWVTASMNRSLVGDRLLRGALDQSLLL